MIALPQITDPLITPTPDNTHPADIEELKKRFDPKKIKEFESYLTYKKLPPPLPKDENPDFPILYVFRHGETTDNASAVFSGWRDIDLTEKGIKQAEELSDKLKDKKIQMLFCSDQLRSIKTMQLAISKNEYAKTLEINQDPRLRERNYGDLQGQSKLKWKLEEPELTKKYRRSWDHPPPNGESVKVVSERVQSFLDEILPSIKKEKVNVAISCHGNSIRGIRRYFEKLDDYETAHIETPLGQDYAAYSIK